MTLKDASNDSVNSILKVFFQINILKSLAKFKEIYCDNSSLAELQARGFQFTTSSKRNEQKFASTKVRNSHWNLRHATLLKKKLWHSCLPVNFVKFLRATFPKNTSVGFVDCLFRWFLFLKKKFSDVTSLYNSKIQHLTPI